jgi:hypothetical protein
MLASIQQRQPYIANNVGPVKLFLKTLLSFHLKEVFSFVFFLFLSRQKLLLVTPPPVLG